MRQPDVNRKLRKSGPLLVVVVWWWSGGKQEAGTADRRREAQDISRWSSSDGEERETINISRGWSVRTNWTDGEPELQLRRDRGQPLRWGSPGWSGSGSGQSRRLEEIFSPLTIPDFSLSETSMWHPREFQSGNSRASMMTTRSGRKI